jgi:hypothetical protein
MALSQSIACAQAEIAALKPTTLISSRFSSTASSSNWSACCGFGGSDRAQADMADEYTTEFGDTLYSSCGCTQKYIIKT